MNKKKNGKMIRKMKECEVWQDKKNNMKKTKMLKKYVMEVAEEDEDEWKVVCRMNLWQQEKQGKRP